MGRILFVIWFLIMSLLGRSCQGNITPDLGLENVLNTETQTASLPKTLSLAYKEESFILTTQALDLADISLKYFDNVERKQSLINPTSSALEEVWVDDLYIALASRDRNEYKVYHLPEPLRRIYYSWQFEDVLGDSDLELVGHNLDDLYIFSIDKDQVYGYDLNEINGYLYDLTRSTQDGHRLNINVKSSSSDQVGHDYKLMFPERFDKIEKIWDGKEFKVFPPKIRPLEKLMVPSIDPDTKRLRWDVKWVIDYGMSMYSDYYVPLAIMSYSLDDKKSIINEGEIEIRYGEVVKETLVIPSQNAWIMETQDQEGSVMVYDPKSPLVTLQAYFGGQDQILDEDKKIHDPGQNEYDFVSDGLSVNVGYFWEESMEAHLWTHAIIKDSAYEVASYFRLGDSKDDIQARLGLPDTIDSEGRWLYHLVNEDGVTIMDYYSREYITFKFSPISQTVETIEIYEVHWLN